MKEVIVRNVMRELEPQESIRPGDHLYGNPELGFLGVITHVSHDHDGKNEDLETTNLVVTTMNSSQLRNGMQTGKYRVLRTTTSTIMEDKLPTSQPEAMKTIPIKEAEQGDTVTIGNMRFTIINIHRVDLMNNQRRFLLKKVGADNTGLLNEGELEFLGAKVSRENKLPSTPESIIKYNNEIYVLHTRNGEPSWIPYTPNKLEPEIQPEHMQNHSFTTLHKAT